MSRRRLAAAFAATCGLLLAYGCGGGSKAAPPVQLGPDLGVEIRLADCTDWKQGTVAERLGTIEQIANYAGGPVDTGSTAQAGATLPAQKAYDLFDNYCKNDYARGFKLYKLYTRAAAFALLQPEGR